MSEASLRRAIEEREEELRDLRKRLEVLREGIAQAHNELHQGTAESCHEVLHDTMHADQDRTPGKVGKLALKRDALAHGMEFDGAFRALCTQHNVDAAYVLAEKSRLLPKKVRLITGGEQKLVRYIGSLQKAAGQQG